MNEENEASQEGAVEAVVDTATEVKEEAPANAEKANEKADGQEGDSPTPEDQEEKSRSQRQRERKKAHIAELEKKAADERAKLERITNAASSDVPPKEEDFDDLTEYAAAKAVFEYNKKDMTRQTDAVSAEIKQIQEQRDRELTANWQLAASEASERLENFDTVAYRPDLAITEEMGSIIKRADNGPDILYHLGTRPAEALRIATMTGPEQVFELGRISAALTAPRPKTQTSAPEPIKPVTGRSNAQRDPAKMSNAEYREWRKKGVA